MKLFPDILCTCVLLAATTGTLKAQPAENPQNGQIKPQTPEEKEKAMQKMVEDAMRQGQEQMAAMMKMTPQERAEELRKLMEKSFRMQLTSFGFADEKLQDTLVKFVNSQEKQRAEVRQAGAGILKIIQEKNGPTDQNIRILFSNYLGAVEDAKAEREQACKDLDDAIDYSAQPRLEAFLTMFGVIGDAAFYNGNLITTGSLSLGGLSEVLTDPPKPKL